MNYPKKIGVSGSGNEIKMGANARKAADKPWWGYVLWILVAAAVGFSIAAVFAGAFEVPRVWYLAIYAPAILAIIWMYFRWSNVDLRKLWTDYWMAGMFVGALVSVFTIRTVLMQASSETPQGASLVFNLAWLGLVYGTVDALLLSVLPVHATLKALEARGWGDRQRSRIIGGILAIVASMFVIGLYHIGYPECREPEVLVIIVGVAVQSLGYVVSRSPLSPVISHVAMHIAAVIHGINSVSQLPPHY